MNKSKPQKRRSISKVEHKLEALKARGARPRAIERAKTKLNRRVLAETNRKERLAKKDK